MVIRQEKNIVLEGKNGRPVVTDVFYSEEKRKKPVIIFCHGYKGFKDWGSWDLMAEAFAEKGFFFIKFNFSHNGGTLEQPIDFPDLDAFAANTFTKELDDLDVILDFLSAPDNAYSNHINTSNFSLIGHSRGGGIAVIKAAEDSRIKQLITLASVSDFGTRFPGGPELELWREKGVAHVENSRTKQQMPHLYDFYKDFKENEERLTISRAATNLHIPFLIIHGTNDPTVALDNAEKLHEWSQNSELFLLEGSNHVFEASHPWEQNELPEAMQKIIDKVVNFVNKKTT